MKDGFIQIRASAGTEGLMNARLVVSLVSNDAFLMDSNVNVSGPF